MNAPAEAALELQLTEFTLNGRHSGCDRWRDHHPGRAAQRHRDSASLLQAGHAAGRQLPRLHGRDQGRARAGAVVLSRADRGHGSAQRQSARSACAEAHRGDARRRRPGAGLQARLGTGKVEAVAGHRQAALRSPHAAGGGPVASGDGGQPRRLHPVHALRARLPRGAGQRRHRLRVSRWPLADRIRPGRPDGRVHVRRLRRMRAGVSDRRACAGARRLSRQGRQDRRVGLPLLRRGMPAHLSRQGQPHRSRRRTRRAGEPRAPVRKGSLTASITCITGNASPSR